LCRGTGRRRAAVHTATALAEDLPLYTRNHDDFAQLDEMLDVVAVPAR
jgi:hypothetical protein